MTTNQFQSVFWRDLWGHEAVPAGMAVYRNTVLTGCIDALLSLYPAVHRLTGDAWMQAVALDFVRADPPASGMLQQYGAGFADFLAAALPAGELPWLHEVARLDGHWQQCHDAADAPVLGLAALAGLDAARLAQARLRLHPATRWHRSAAWPVFHLWQAARDGAGDPNPPAWQAEGVLLTRPAAAVQACPLDAVQAVLLQACAEGCRLGEALESAQIRCPQADAGAALGALLNHGAFAGVTEEVP